LDHGEEDDASDNNDKEETRNMTNHKRRKVESSIDDGETKRATNYESIRQVERSKRRTNDGCLLAKKESLHRNIDGTYAKPVGAPPHGLKWDSVRGLWAPPELVTVTYYTDSTSSPKAATAIRLPLKLKKKPVVQYSSDESSGEEDEDDDDDEDDENDDGGDGHLSSEDERDDGEEKVQEQEEKVVADEESKSVKPPPLSREAERMNRRTEDGCLLPKNPPVRNEDGTYAKPMGAVPRNLEWDPIRGLWAPSKEQQETSAPASSHPNTPPRKKKKKRRTSQRLVEPDVAASAAIESTSVIGADTGNDGGRVERRSTVVRLPTVKLSSSQMFPSFLLFKKRRQYKARTKSNPTGIIGGDNIYMKNVNKRNWGKIKRLMHRRDDWSSSYNIHREDELSSQSTTTSSGESAMAVEPIPEMFG